MLVVRKAVACLWLRGWLAVLLCDAVISTWRLDFVASRLFLMVKHTMRWKSKSQRGALKTDRQSSWMLKRWLVSHYADCICCGESNALVWCLFICLSRRGLSEQHQHSCSSGCISVQHAVNVCLERAVRVWYIIRPHRICEAYRRCNLLPAMFMGCLWVCWSRGCIVAKWLDRSRCHLAVSYTHLTLPTNREV